MSALTEGQRNAMNGGPDRNKERAQEIIDKREQRFDSNTAPMIGPRGRLGVDATEDNESDDT